MVDPRSRRSRRHVGLAIAIAWLVGVAVGWGLRDLAHPTHDAPLLPRDDPSASTSVQPGSAFPDGAARDAALRLWSDLAVSLATRSTDLEALLEQLRAETGDPRAAIDRAIAESSDAELATILSAVTRIDADRLREQGDLRPFATRLVEVALDGLDGPSNEPPARGRIHFTTTTIDFDPARDDRDTFAADEGRIFAMIDLGDYESDHVMVKWRNAATGRIHSLQSLRHYPGRPLWSYLVRDGGWEPGVYEVSVYSQDARMALLGRGEYTVFPPEPPADRSDDRASR